MELVDHRVRDVRALVARVEASDITNPDLPHLTAVELIVRMKVAADILAGHAETQQARINELQAQLLEAQSRVSRLEADALNAADLVAA